MAHTDTTMNVQTAKEMIIVGTVTGAVIGGFIANAATSGYPFATIAGATGGAVVVGMLGWAFGSNDAQPTEDDEAN